VLTINEILKVCNAIIGNFPYNISTQIVFRTLEYRDQIPEFAGMFQKVAQQFAKKREQKRMEFYRFWFRLFMMRVLFTVDEHVFIPPPR
jgi:16S rRNA (adenine1518-N6/adenine1519-N6)-dimethyltransferase